MYELTGEIFSVSLLFVRLDKGVLYETMENIRLPKKKHLTNFYLCCIMNIQNENKVREILLYKIQNR